MQFSLKPDETWEGFKNGNRGVFWATEWWDVFFHERFMGFHQENGENWTCVF